MYWFYEQIMLKTHTHTHIIDSINQYADSINKLHVRNIQIVDALFQYVDSINQYCKNTTQEINIFKFVAT